MEILHKDNMAIYQGAIPLKLCADIVALFERNNAKGSCYDGVSGMGNVQPDVKKSKDMRLDGCVEGIPLQREILSVIDDCLVNYLMLNKGMLFHFAGCGNIDYTKVTEEAVRYHLPRTLNVLHTQVQKYTVGDGGYPAWHCESSGTFQRGQEGNDTDLRVLTYMFYLNDVEEGGETQFINQNIALKPKAGTLVIFPAWPTHIHKGNKPLSGDKYIGTSWISING
jgi:hypothetical protein